MYLIRHNKTNRIYIGSSANPQKRFNDHIYRLRNGHHPVGDMQQDFNTYGEDYSFELLEVITTYKDGMHEYDWMEKYNSHIRGSGYNYKDYANRKRARKTKSSRGELLRRIKSLTDEEVERLVAFLEMFDGKDNT